MKLTALLTALAISTTASAGTVYIGDSIAHGYRTFNHGDGVTKVGAQPKEVSRFLDRAPSGDASVLSTGASNNCKDLSTVRANISKALSMYRKVYLLSAPYCGYEFNKIIVNECYGNCEFFTVKAGKDGIHPSNYRHKF